METFTRLAGMTETPNDPHHVPDPPPIPQDPIDNTDAQSQYSRTSRRGSRVSLPINRRPSHHSFRSRSSKRASRVDRPEDYPPLPTSQPSYPEQQQRRSHESQRSRHSESEDGDEDFVWGPNHPCFPHPNPHCDPNSEEARTTRVIRVKRDYLQAGDLYPQYANVYPEILDPLVSDPEFRSLITNLNSRLAKIFNPYATRAWVDSLMGVATGFVWEDLGFTGVKMGVQELEKWVDGWNAESERKGKEVKVVQLRRTGFMSLDVVVPDPGIDVIRDEGGGGIGPAE